MDPQIAQLRERIRDLEAQIDARQRVLDQQALPPGRLGKLIELVAIHWRIEAGELMGQCRRPAVALPRLVAMALAHRCLGMSRARIAQAMNRHESTVSYAVQKITADCLVDDNLARTMNRIAAAVERLPHPHQRTAA